MRKISNLFCALFVSGLFSAELSGWDITDRTHFAGLTYQIPTIGVMGIKRDTGRGTDAIEFIGEWGFSLPNVADELSGFSAGGSISCFRTAKLTRQEMTGEQGEEPARNYTLRNDNYLGGLKTSETHIGFFRTGESDSAETGFLTLGIRKINKFAFQVTPQDGLEDWTKDEDIQGYEIGINSINFKGGVKNFSRLSVFKMEKQVGIYYHATPLWSLRNFEVVKGLDFSISMGSLTVLWLRPIIVVQAGIIGISF